MKMRSKKPHYNVAAGVILKEDRILISRRPEGSHLAGLWEFPGGKQEKGESLEDCLEREIKEELGLLIETGKSLVSVDHSYRNKDISLHVFYCRVIKGEPKGMECQDVRWVDLSHLSGFSFPPPDKKVVEFISAKNNLKFQE